MKLVSENTVCFHSQPSAWYPSEDDFSSLNVTCINFGMNEENDKKGGSSLTLSIYKTPHPIYLSLAHLLLKQYCIFDIIPVFLVRNSGH